MARQVHGREGAITKPTTRLDPALGADAHVNEVALVVDGPSGPIPVQGTSGGEIKVSSSAAGESPSTTATRTSVAATGSTVTLLAANASRKKGGVKIYNDAATRLVVAYGLGASSTNFTFKMNPDSYFEMDDFYTGVLTGYWEGTPSGAARITELT